MREWWHAAERQRPYDDHHRIASPTLDEVAPLSEVPQVAAVRQLRVMPRAAAAHSVSDMAKAKSPSAAVPYLSVAERVAHGRAARKEVSRSTHAIFEPASGRADPVELLERQGTDPCAGARADPLRAHAGLEESG
jgi:hypothetical protein